MLKSGKLAALGLLKAAGISGAIGRSRWRSHRLLILCYHGISIQDEHEWDGQLYMPVGLFEERMRLVAELGYRVLPLSEGLRRLRDNDLDRPSVAITFDDGNHDFSQRAYPVLRQLGFPVTVYLTTYYCLFGRPVFDPCSGYLLWRGGQTAWNAKTLLGQDQTFDLTTARGYSAAHSLLLRQTRERGYTGEQKDEILRQLAAEMNVEYNAVLAKGLFRLLSPDEVTRLAADGVDIQLHTHRHRTPRDRVLFTREIVDNAAVIERLTGKAPEHFCYPSGDYQPAFLEWLSELKVKSATTCEAGMCSPGTPPLLLPRLVDTTGVSWLEFTSWLHGTSQLLPKRPAAKVPEWLGTQ